MKDEIRLVKEVEDDDKLLEKCDMVVCMEATEERIALVPPMWKNEIGYGNCSLCDAPVFFRNNVPKAMKVCHSCAMDVVAEDDNPMFLTRKSGADELRAYLKKKEQN